MTDNAAPELQPPFRPMMRIIETLTMKNARYAQLIYILFFFSLALNSHSKQPTGMPYLLYWAWEAPHDMTGLDPLKAGIAELTASIYIKGNQLIYHRRQQPLHAPEAIYRIAVIHIEARPRWQPLLDKPTAEKIALAIKKIYSRKKYNALQIDFEVSPAQRTFYRHVLLALRQLLGRKQVISITALASWCTSDRWIGPAKLPVDMVVPMYFSLNRDRLAKQAFIHHFPHAITRLAPECQSAIGLATFEPWQMPLRAKVPVFVFTRGSWNIHTLEQAEQLAFAVQH
ncbi:hypothetical protein [Legionella erythra]|uniref:DUF3142 domain-containing protein n=1 Tax=Legionella erythra TaxID=448 RepID=A0A0W0TU16_LEGER|nr:hypothetical protein [Legionella erythra]KTC99103.1 hypothetical protein Lery_0642 [Legionella erythra]